MSALRYRSLLVLLVFLIAASAHAQRRSVMGFADVNYLATEGDRVNGFDLGQLVGHAAFGLSERVTVFTEVSLTGRSTGYSAEVERLLFRYDFSDYLKLSAGRYHTPISYWNVAFHHGLWLQTTVGRPQYTRFGSRFVPVHFLGLLAEGSFPESRFGPSYFAGIGNGRADDIARAGDAGDFNDARAWLFGLNLRPEFLYGLQTGVAVYRDRIGAETAVQTQETIYAAHVVWEKEHPEFLAEYARVFHEDELGSNAWSDAYYAQIAYRLLNDLRAFKPYARYERIDVPLGDPVFGPLDLGYEAGILGVRYDFAQQAALKVEYRNEQIENGDRTNGLFLQASFSFPVPVMDHQPEMQHQ